MSVFNFFFILATPHGLWDLSSLNSDSTLALAVKALSPNHWTTKKFLGECNFQVHHVEELSPISMILLSFDIWIKAKVQ